MTILTGRVILILGTLTAFAPFSIDMYLPSLPTLQRVFAAPAASVQLTLSAFFAGLAIGQAFYGPLSDRFGRKPPLYAGVALYTLASLGCALSATVDQLTALRFLQALGGCAGGVIARAIVRDVVSGPEAARVFSTLMLVMGVAPILAPLIGGYVLLAAGWRTIFVLLTLLGVASLLAAAFGLPETRPPAVRSSGGVVHALRIYGRLLTQGRFIGFMLATGFAFAGMFVYISASPVLFIERFGVPPESYGWLFGANAAGLIGASQLNRLLLRRMTLYRALALGLAVNLAATLALIAVAIGTDSLAALVVPLFVAIASLGIINPNASAAAMAGDPAHAGSASALLGTAPFLLGAGAAAIESALADGSPVSMAGVIAGCSAAAFLSHRLLAGGRAAA